jgi:tetratricopeptide (TPR) repeat protein
MVSSTFYVVEYLTTLLRAEMPGATAEWKKAFDRAIDARDIRFCEALLLEVKRFRLAPVDLAQVRRQEGRLRHFMHDWDNAISCFQQSLSLFETLGDVKNQSLVLSELGGDLHRAGKWDHALRCYQHALELDQQLEDKNAASYDYRDIAGVLEDQGRYAEAIDHYFKTIPSLEGSTDRGRGASIIGSVAACMSAMGRLNQAIPLLDLAIKLRTDHHSTGYANALTNLGSVLRRQGKLEEALIRFDEALTIAFELQNFHLQSVLVNHLGTIFYDQGEYERAEEKYQLALEMKRQLGDERGIGVVLNNLGVLYRDTQRYEAATQCLEEDLQLRQRLGDVRGIAIAHNNLGTTLSRLGRDDDAEAHYLQAVSTCRGVGIVDVQAISLRKLADLYRAQGQDEAAAFAAAEAQQLDRQVRGDQEDDHATT